MRGGGVNCEVGGRGRGCGLYTCVRGSLLGLEGVPAIIPKKCQILLRFNDFSADSEAVSLQRCRCLLMYDSQPSNFRASLPKSVPMLTM